MYYGNAYAGNAGRRYASIQTGSRIEGATPHGLVKILYDELLIAIDTAVAAQSSGDIGKTNEKHSRAMSILHALDASLDFDKGGDIALSLAQIYKESRRLLLLSVQQKSNEEALKARAILAEIAAAWEAIGQ
jgi:flagellar secretion chaperone FliS